MPLRKYTASADTTIVNAYRPDLENRATGANMGRSDILETFSIYGRATTSSAELSRILLKFPVGTIESDRTNSLIPASGNVSFYLKMYDAPTSKTVPRDYKLNVYAISSSWQEGDGLDMEGYTDKTKGNPGANWMVATNNSTTASTTITVSSYANVTAGDSIAITTPEKFRIFATASSNTTTDFNSFFPSFQKETDASTTAKNLADCLNAVAYLTASNAAAIVTVHQTSSGIGGNTNIVITQDASGLTLGGSGFSGGSGSWYEVGGDYLTASTQWQEGIDPPVYSQTFDTGLEDLEIDITDLVENWISGTLGNYGVGVHLTKSYEAYYSSSRGEEIPTGSVLDNLDGVKKSYYTKRFFARGTQYFFKRPTIEARWNDIIRDDRGNFFFSSSRAPAVDNLHTLYFYNYIRGRLVDLPTLGIQGTGGPEIHVSLFSGSGDNTRPSGSKLELYDGNTNITGGRVSTGIYSCSIAIASSSTSPLYDVWHTGGVEIFTGSILPTHVGGGQIIGHPNYYINITNMKGLYRTDEEARFNLFVREKNWSPNIYTVANNAPEVIPINSASYKVYRLVDGYPAVPYGTGSDLYSVLSYDVSGNYFDFDMSLLKGGYAYAFKFSFYDERLDSWIEQRNSFKFRVEDYEY